MNLLEAGVYDWGVWHKFGMMSALGFSTAMVKIGWFDVHLLMIALQGGLDSVNVSGMPSRNLRWHAHGKLPGGELQVPCPALWVMASAQSGRYLLWSWPSGYNSDHILEKIYTLIQGRWRIQDQSLWQRI